MISDYWFAVDGQGDVMLTLDVNSLNYNAGPNHPPAVTTAADCCSACKADSQVGRTLFMILASSSNDIQEEFHIKVMLAMM